MQFLKFGCNNATPAIKKQQDWRWTRLQKQPAGPSISWILRFIVYTSNQVFKRQHAVVLCKGHSWSTTIWKLWNHALRRLRLRCMTKVNLNTSHVFSWIRGNQYGLKRGDNSRLQNWRWMTSRKIITIHFHPLCWWLIHPMIFLTSLLREVRSLSRWLCRAFPAAWDSFVITGSYFSRTDFFEGPPRRTPRCTTCHSCKMLRWSKVWNFPSDS